MRWKWVAVCVMTCTVTLPAIPSQAADEIKTLQSVGGEAEGAAAARAARDALVNGGAANLLPILQGFNGSSKLASNWLRSSFEAIADNQLQSKKGLPKEELLAFVRDTTQSPSARRLAYEWLLKETPALEDELIPGMLLDPSADFRRDAVSKLIDQAKDASGKASVAIYEKALQGAVHEDHVRTISEALREAGVKVDIQKHFGFLTSWKIIGPFDNREMAGFAVAYPPETEINPGAEYKGQLGQVSWTAISTEDDYGLVNIAKQIENYKGSAMYATTTFRSEGPQQVQFRLGTPNAWKLWVNGKLIFQREEYHRGSGMDQYTIPVILKDGANSILLKVCQNEQEQPWAQDYEFQLRVCNATGAAILPKGNRADVSQSK
ncbi:MAG: hypothetical protein AAGI63_04200 [Planctomycetota bacterium]